MLLGFIGFLFCFLSFALPFLSFWFFLLLLFDFPFRCSPCHNVTDEDEHFVVFKGLLHGFDSEVDVRYLSFINVIDIDFTLLDSFLSEKLGFFPFEDLLDA